MFGYFNFELPESPRSILWKAVDRKMALWTSNYDMMEGSQHFSNDAVPTEASWMSLSLFTYTILTNLLLYDFKNNTIIGEDIITDLTKVIKFAALE